MENERKTEEIEELLRGQRPKDEMLVREIWEAKRCYIGKVGGVAGGVLDLLHPFSCLAMFKKPIGVVV